MPFGFGKFVYNPTAEELLKHTAEMAAHLKYAAEKGADAAKAVAPVRTGDYRDSIEADSSASEGKARVLATDFKAQWIEFGTIHTPTFAPLRRGAESAGLKVEASGKYR